MSKNINVLGWCLMIIFSVIELFTGDADVARDWLILAFLFQILAKLDELEESVF